MSKTCRSCQTRNVATGTLKGADRAFLDIPQARAVELCNLCLAEADYENVHSDDGHGNSDEESIVDGCWICHPELNQAANATARQSSGTSRAGMVITVPIRAAAKTKAATVVTRLGDGYATSVRTVKGITTLKASQAAGVGVVLRWDTQGRFLGGEAGVDGTLKKVRNVAEAYRVLGA